LLFFCLVDSIFLSYDTSAGMRVFTFGLMILSKRETLGGLRRLLEMGKGAMAFAVVNGI
jgi:hypothetical protein